MQNKQLYEVPPIAFMIFNRPDYTKQVFEAIRAAQPKKLFVIADGPRTPEEVAVCEQTRAIIDQVDWDCEVHKNYAERNLGLKERISSGLSWFFENVEAGIILEDDCLPHPSFFQFTAEMLEQYKDDERVMMISGDNFLPELTIEDSYFFSRYFPIWGWATWRRAWKHYDVSISSWGNPANKKKLKMFYEQPYMQKHTEKIFDGIYDGKLNTWDIQWLYLCLMGGGYCITPGVNLISNIGISGTHSGGGNQNLPVYDLYARPFVHPDQISTNHAYDNIFYEKSFKPKRRTLFKAVRSKAIEIAVRYEIIKKIHRLLAGKKKK